MIEPLTNEEVDTLLDAMTNPRHLFIVYLFLNGIKRGDVHAILEHRDYWGIDGNDRWGCVWVNNRLLTMDPVAYELFNLYRTQNIDVSDQAISQMLRHCGIAANIDKPITTTNLRATWIIKAINENIPFERIMEQAGLGSRKMVYIYRQIAIDLQEAAIGE